MSGRLRLRKGRRGRFRRGVRSVGNSDPGKLKSRGPKSEGDLPNLEGRRRQAIKDLGSHYEILIFGNTPVYVWSGEELVKKGVQKILQREKLVK